MILKKKIPKDFYKLFRTQNMDYYMQLLTDLYRTSREAYALSQLTDAECKSILAETIAKVNLVWWEDETERADESGFLGLTPSAVLDRLVKWGWLSSDFDERLNCYIISFPEYSRMYVELFERLGQEDESRERESILSVYSALYTYHSDPEKNNSILKSAVQTSKNLGQMLSDMQDGMRAWFDELSARKDFIGIQEVLVSELNNSDSKKYAILTTTDSFYRYKEAVKELISDILNENEQRREELCRTLERQLTAAEQPTASAQPTAAEQPMESGQPGTESPQVKRLRRGIAFCEEAAQLVVQAEREFDLIEKKYNRLIELKTVFARRALARIHYILQEGSAQEDQTLVLINLLTRSRKKDEILEKLRECMHVTAPFTVLSDSSLYSRRTRQESSFCPVKPTKAEPLEMDDFVPRPLYTGYELEEFREKNSLGGAFCVSEETVSSVEDLEKLLFIWQEATKDRLEEDRIELKDEIRQKNGFTYTGFTLNG